MAGPGLLAYIIRSKFSDYLPLYRCKTFLSGQGFEISRATQSIWCGDVADLVTPLYALMGERVRHRIGFLRTKLGSGTVAVGPAWRLPVHLLLPITRWHLIPDEMCW